VTAVTTNEGVGADAKEKEEKEAMKSAKVVLAVLMVLCMFSTMSFADDYTPPPGVPGPGEVDLGGATVTLIGLNLDTRSTWEWGAFWETFDQRKLEAEQLFNCKITFIHGGNYGDHVRNRIMAGESTHDIIINRAARDFGYYGLLQDGLLLATSDILPPEYFDTLGNSDKGSILKLEYKGKLYGFGTIFGDINNSMQIWAYNKTMLEREGQPDPYQLWLEGNWTWEQFEKIAKAVTRDTDGDGVVDQWGSYDLAGDSAGLLRNLAWNGVEISRVDETGKRVFALDSPVAIETINTLVNGRTAGYMAVGVSGADFVAGNVAFSGAHIMGHRFAKQSLQDEWALVPPPVWPNVDRPQYFTFAWRTNFLPANVTDPLGLIAVWSYLVRPDDSLNEEHLTQLFDQALPPNQESFEVYMTAVEQFEGEGDHFEGTALWNDIVRPALTSIINGEKGAAAAMAEIKPRAQAFLDDLFAQ
jgi:ABC-type glycerol-3-phosphate transport system substrate-binding protein